MKKQFLLLGAILFGVSALAQQAPTNTAPSGAGPSGQNSAQYWSRAGNNNFPVGNTNNIFGTLWNSPIYTKTSDVLRMKLNGAFTNNATQYDIDGYSVWGNTATTVNTTGYLLLGPNAPFQTTTSQTIYNDKGAYSLLHLNGSDLIQQNGYRPWMKTGITFTDNQDLSYIGLRKIGTGLDVTETTINWSDNAGPGQVGPDDFVIRFTGAGTSSVLNSTNYRASNDLDGIHIGRFTGFGLFGLGNTFGIQDVNDPINLYSRPQSLFHASYDWQNGAGNEQFGFMQVTYRRPYLQPNDIIGQGEAATDGLRFGIDNDIFSTADKQHLNSYLRWQEASSFIIQTEDNNSSNIQQNERLRVTSIGALAANYDTNTYIGLKTPTQVSRISISHNGGNALSRPMSLMHLGYNIGSTFGPYHLKFGWREWMDLGMLVSNNTDNVYIGLKPRNGAATATNNEMDAVISWGNDAEYATASAGIDVMSFIYTAEPLSPVDSSAATSQEGLEVVRMYPGKDVYYDSGDSIYGRVGIGDFTISGVNEQPTHKLDVVGNGRFRYLPDSLYFADSLVNKYVMVDSAGVLRWSSVSPGGFGAACADSINGKLQFDTKVDLNNHNFYFTKNDSLNVNHVGIGYDCSLALPGKLSVLQNHPTSVAIGTVAIDAHNEDIANTMPLTFYGTKTLVDGDQILPRITHIGGDFTARNAQINIGMNALVSNSSFENATDFGLVSEVKDDSALVTYGGWFTGKGGSNSNWGIYASAAPQDVNGGQPSLLGYGGRFASANHQKRNVGVWGIASDDFPSAYHQQSECFGVVGIAKKGASNYAVYGEVEPGTNNYAGYFAGPVVMNQSAIWSDENLKENIDNLELADSLLNLINPVTFTYRQTGDAERLNLPEGTRYGMIAQQVEQVFPNFVTIAKHPAELDSAGNIISAAFEYKVLDLEQFIPVILKDAQLKNEKIENLEDEVNAQDSLINDLNNRLTQLENCLSNILPALCNANSMAVQSTPVETQEHLEKAINVTLSNRNNIVLNQNVPNPFAESTIITYSIPATVQKAQIHFYDGTGKLINSVDIIERGNGQLNVFANDLSTGVYTYSLVADGQIVSTKRMMKQ
jgi:hypothetical protein